MENGYQKVEFTKINLSVSDKSIISKMAITNLFQFIKFKISISDLINFENGYQ